MAKSQGLVGIDVAYTIALLGMMLSNVFFVIGDHEHFLKHTSYFVILDFFAAFFFFLTGFTLSLGLRDRRVSSRRALSNTLKKGSGLFFVGLVFASGWAMNAFIACGMFFMLAAFIAKWSTMTLRIFSVLVLLLSMILVNIHMDTFPDAEFHSLKLQGAGVRELASFMLFNGYYSFLPWFFFFVVGMTVARGDVRPTGAFPPSSLGGILIIVLSFFVEIYSKKINAEVVTWSNMGYYPLNTKFFLPSFLLLETGICIVVLNALKYVYRKGEKSQFVQFSRDVATSKFSAYFFMLVFGSLVLWLFNSIIFHSAIILFLLNVVLCLLSLYLAIFWKKRFNSKPPMEWLIERVSNPTKS